MNSRTLDIGKDCCLILRQPCRLLMGIGVIGECAVAQRLGIGGSGEGSDCETGGRAAPGVGGGY